MRPDRTYDIAVVGAGATGLVAALAFAHDGFSVALVGEPDMRRDGRTVALLDGSVQLLTRLGAWPRIAPAAAPLEVMRLVDDTPNLFRAPTASFSADEIGLGAFGWNVENAVLVEALAELVSESPTIEVVRGRAVGLGSQNVSGPGGEERRVTVMLEQNPPVCAALAVAAEGRNSSLREAAGIHTRRWSYPQSALTTILGHDRDHRNTSTEFHTRHGPFTLVPLRGRRSSLVWVTQPDRAARLAELDDAALALAVERQAQSILGAMRIEGPRGVVPMTGLWVEAYVGERLALVGETAHVFPPIGAQGLNLGLRDVAALRDALVEARELGRDIGGEATLARYQRGRRLDVGLRTAAVDALNRTLLAGLLPTDFLRGAGIHALRAFGPLRRLVMREGVTPVIGTPSLMRRAKRATTIRRLRQPGKRS